MSDKEAALVPEQGWHCLHLYYRIEFSQWELLSAEEQRAAKVALSSLVQEIRALESTQLLTLSIVTPKADLGFMLSRPICTRQIESKNSSLSVSVRMFLFRFTAISP